MPSQIGAEAAAQAARPCATRPAAQPAREKRGQDDGTDSEKERRDPQREKRIAEDRLPGGKKEDRERRLVDVPRRGMVRAGEVIELVAKITVRRDRGELGGGARPRRQGDEAPGDLQGFRLATSASKSFPAAATLRRGPVSLKNTAPFGPSAIAPRRT